jgi:hypothetical protein
MKWTRRSALVMGVAIIALANLLALAGVAYNRGDEPESVLQLTQRELQLPYNWAGKKEDSGVALQLNWRVLSSDPDWPAYRWDAAWLDAAKMASLGFNTALSMVESKRKRGSSDYQRQLPREVYIVLELNGPASQTAHALAIQQARETEAKNKDGNGKKDAQFILDRESGESRLFAVDAGLDPQALRSRYPDRSSYVIVRGQVRPAWSMKNHPGAGIIEELLVSSINVPLGMHAVFDGERVRQAVVAGCPCGFDARVAFGKRGEPWLLALSKP